MLYTTLNRLRAAGACTEGYAKLLKHLGGPAFDHEQPIALVSVLDSNGLDDALWCLRATTENCDRFARLLACDFAEAVLPIFEKMHPGDERPRDALKVSRSFAIGEASALDLQKARDAAWDAARDAAWDAARDAAWAAAWDAARDAAWAAARAAARDAARDAAWDAAWDAARDAARDDQAEKFRAALIAHIEDVPA